MKYLKFAITAMILLAAFSQVAAAQNDSWKQDRKAGIMFGLTQPIVVDGFNIEGFYAHNRFTFNYSHGVSLDFSGDLLPSYLQDQGVVVHMPFSTGFGIGYRLTEWLNLRIEPKWHRFEFYYEGDAQTSENRIAADANNYSVGLGLYGFYQPFKSWENALKGITIAPSVRFWPTVASSFNNNRFSYQSDVTGRTEQLKTPASGIGFSPLIINVSVGYTFNFSK
ncbi:MAG: hypothetical protein LAT67_11470 [Balneolales bacterium]|nr:hypothetical protein [Balneolales bacterium]